MIYCRDQICTSLISAEGIHLFFVDLFVFFVYDCLLIWNTDNIVFSVKQTSNSLGHGFQDEIS